MRAVSEAELVRSHLRACPGWRPEGEGGGGEGPEEDDATAHIRELQGETANRGVVRGTSEVGPLLDASWPFLQLPNPDPQLTTL